MQRARASAARPAGRAEHRRRPHDSACRPSAHAARKALTCGVAVEMHHGSAGPGAPLAGGTEEADAPPPPRERVHGGSGDVASTLQIRMVETVCNGNKRPIRWPMGAHAEARLGLAEFAKLVAGAHKLPVDIFEHTKSRLTYQDGDGQQRLIRTTDGLRTALREQKTLVVGVELVLPKQHAEGAGVMSDRQRQLRQKLVARRPQRPAAKTQLEQWTMMDLRRDQWKTWQQTVCSVFQTVPDLIERASVRYVVPPRSNQHGQQVYCLMPVAKAVHLFSFSVFGRRFAVMSDADQANDAELRGILAPLLSSDAAERRGCTILPGSQSVIAQDLTILLAMELECIMAVRELSRGFADLNGTMADALLRPSLCAASKWIYVCGLPVNDFVPKEETELEREAREAQARLLEEERAKAQRSLTAKPKKPENKKNKHSSKGAVTIDLTARADKVGESHEITSPAQTEPAPSSSAVAATTSASKHMSQGDEAPQALEANLESLEIDPEVYAIAMSVPDLDEDQGSDWQFVSKRRQHRSDTREPTSGTPGAVQLSPKAQSTVVQPMQNHLQPQQQQQVEHQQPRTPQRDHNRDEQEKADQTISEGPRLSPGAERKPSAQPAEQVLLFGSFDEHAVAGTASTDSAYSARSPNAGSVFHSPAAIRLENSVARWRATASRGPDE
eukprot:SAG31_NODE_416_length_15934_cov_7.384970_16_plen_672_part_00